MHCIQARNWQKTRTQQYKLKQLQVPGQVLEQGGEDGHAAGRRRRRLPRQAPQGQVQPVRPQSEQEGPLAPARPLLAEV